MNQKKLAETVCENKDKPKSCCAAKCHLEKEIKKEDKRQSDFPASIKDKLEKSELKTGILIFGFNSAYKELENIFIYKQQILKSFYASVFHPPTTAFTSIIL